MSRHITVTVWAIAITIFSFILSILSFAQQPSISVYTKLPAAPEGLCIDSSKNLYATMPSTGEVVLLKNDGTYEHVAWVPSKEQSGRGEIYGIEADKEGNLYVAYVQDSGYLDINADLLNKNHPACHDVKVTKSGVYRIDANTRQVRPVATRGDGWPFCFPDDVAIDKTGNIYLTDLTYPGIWKISPDGKNVALWSDDPLLGWLPDTSLPMGVNALVLDKDQKNLYCDTTSRDGRIVKIPIKEDGNADDAIMYSRGHTWFDGIEIDSEGYVYGSLPGSNEIVIIPPKRYPNRIVIQSSLFQGPTSLVLRDGILYAANLGSGWSLKKKYNTVVAIRIEDFVKKQK